MGVKKYRVAVIGCGAHGESYAKAYTTYPDTELVAIAEYNPERRKAMGEKYNVKALYPDAHSLFTHIVPDIAAVVLPVKYMPEAVIAAAEAGVKGVSCDKPMAARLSDADAMLEACRSRGVVFAGGVLQRAMNEVQEAAGWIKSGRFGKLTGAVVHYWGYQVSGGGCQHISVLRLFTGAEVQEVISWAKPLEALKSGSDTGLTITSWFKLSNGMNVPGFTDATPYRGVDVWSDRALVRWDWAPPVIYEGFDDKGVRIKSPVNYTPYQWSEFGYLTGSVRSFIKAIETGSEMAISGHDLRQALEVAIAARESAVQGNKPMRLPLEDRSLAIYPSAYRWFGGAFGTVQQTPQEAMGKL